MFSIQKEDANEVQRNHKRHWGRKNRNLNPGNATSFPVRFVVEVNMKEGSTLEPGCLPAWGPAKFLRLVYYSLAPPSGRGSTLITLYVLTPQPKKMCYILVLGKR